MDPQILRELGAFAPYPVVQLAVRAQNDCSPERAHHNAYYVGELWLRMATAVLAGRYVAESRRDVALDEALGHLTQPTVGYLIAFASRYIDELGPEPLRAWWRAEIGQGCAAGYAWACEHGNEKVVPHPSYAHLVRALSAYRNRQVGHGAVRERAFYRDGADALFEATCRVALSGTAALGGRFLAIEEVAEDMAGTRSAAVLDLTGSILTRLTEPLTEDQLGSSFRKGHVLFDDKIVRVRTSPWLLWDRGYVQTLNRASARKLEYLSYFTGESLSTESTLGDLHLALTRGTRALPQQLDAGTTSDWIAGYERLRELGRGGMGTVYLARQISLDMPVAVKLLPSGGIDDTARARFRREIEILKRCEHPGIVSVLDAGEAPDTAYYVMEYVSGCTLAQVYSALQNVPLEQRAQLLGSDLKRVINRISRENATDEYRRIETDAPAGTGSDKPIEASLWTTLLRRFADVAFALEYLHRRGVVHRDIKPANIMLTDDASRAVLMDLGIAQTRGATIHTATGSFIGTLRYASREQIQRTSDEIDFRADLYSLGATMYELFTLTPLHAETEDEARQVTDASLLERILTRRPAPALERNPSVQPELAIVLEKLLEKQPEHRFYRSAGELANDLLAICEQRPLRAREYTPDERRAFELYESLREQAAAYARERGDPTLLWPEERASELERLRVAETFHLSESEEIFRAATIQHAAALKKHRLDQEKREHDLKLAAETLRRRVRRGAAWTTMFVLATIASVALRHLATVNRQLQGAYLLKGERAEEEKRWDEALLYYGQANRIGFGGDDKVREKARDGLARERSAPVRSRFVWSLSTLPRARYASFSSDGKHLAVAVAARIATGVS